MSLTFVKINKKRYYTPKELAQITGRSVQWVHLKIQQGKIPYKIDKLKGEKKQYYLFSKEDVDIILKLINQDSSIIG